MYKYRVFDKTIYRFRNVMFKDRVENLTKMQGREFKCTIKHGDGKRYIHLCRVIEGPIEV